LNGKVSLRIEELRRRGNPGAAPLWAETLSPDEALTELSGVGEPWARLLRARAHSTLGRRGEALAELEGLGGGLPPGLARMAGDLRERISAVPAQAASVGPAEIMEETAEERPGGQKGSDAELKRWLDRVRNWRTG